jgi:hypothetical protein
MRAATFQEILTESSLYANIGLHSLAIDKLDAAMSFEPEREGHKRVYKSLLLLEKAAHLYQQGSSNLATEAIAMVSHDVRKSNPAVEARCQSIYGLVARQSAHAESKVGNAQAALILCEAAKQRFANASDASIYGQLTQQKLAAELNTIYLNGLIAAIHGKSRVENPSLMEALVEVTDDLYEHTPGGIRNRVVGATMLADLGYGAGLTLNSFLRLNLQSANWITQYASWPEMLVNLAMKSPTGYVDKYKALRLAVKMLVAVPNYSIEQNQSLAKKTILVLNLVKLDLQKLQGNVQATEAANRTIYDDVIINLANAYQLRPYDRRVLK